jgi:hypothetical protein
VDQCQPSLTMVLTQAAGKYVSHPVIVAEARAMLTSFCPSQWLAAEFAPRCCKSAESRSTPSTEDSSEEPITRFAVPLKSSRPTDNSKPTAESPECISKLSTLHCQPDLLSLTPRATSTAQQCDRTVTLSTSTYFSYPLASEPGRRALAVHVEPRD